jgi:hypothetical protein
MRHKLAIAFTSLLIARDLESNSAKIAWRIGYNRTFFVFRNLAISKGHGPLHSRMATTTHILAVALTRGVNLRPVRQP